MESSLVKAMEMTSVQIGSRVRDELAAVAAVAGVQLATRGGEG